jgi:protein TonB
MGYQALLFCPDEKLARVVSQVFTELDFTVEPVHEPFGAVKKLMTQRYDAIVVDCENEQNASLLFKSARNSSSNQTSLAIAVVEGQAGVAKAYRIGANLVLTKPINVEQAKGTLRVARGLLRKNSDAANANPVSAPITATTSKPVPVFNSSSVPRELEGPAAIAPAPLRQELPDFQAPVPAQLPVPIPAAIPAVAVSTKIEDIPSPVHVPVAQSPVAAEPPVVSSVEPQLSASNSALRNDIVKNNEPMTAAPAQSASIFASASGSAAAPAPAREVIAPAIQEPVAASASYDAAPMFSTTDAPSFQGLGDEESSGSGSNKKVLIAAAVILALAALGYFGYGKFDKSNTNTPAQPASAAQSSGEPSPTLAPMPATAAVPGGQILNGGSSAASIPPAKATTIALGDKALPTAGSSAPARIAISGQPETSKPVPAPIIVKSTAPTSRTQAQADETAPVLPGTVAAASANDSNLTSLISSATSAPRPSLATPKISQGVLQGLLIKRVQPKYPPAALAVHAQGAVQIEATITKDGTVVAPKVLSGDPVLARAAIDAVKQWRYKPYYLDGEPVEIQTQITINFKAD